MLRFVAFYLPRHWLVGAWLVGGSLSRARRYRIPRRWRKDASSSRPNPPSTFEWDPAPFSLEAASGRTGLGQ
jgi:hypothetical protein